MSGVAQRQQNEYVCSGLFRKKAVFTSKSLHQTVRVLTEHACKVGDLLSWCRLRHKLRAADHRRVQDASSSPKAGAI